MSIVRRFPGREHFDFFPVLSGDEITPGLVYRHRLPHTMTIDLCVERLSDDPDRTFRFLTEGGLTLFAGPDDITRWLRDGIEVGYANGRVPWIQPPTPVGPRLRPSGLARRLELETA